MKVLAFYLFFRKIGIELTCNKLIGLLRPYVGVEIMLTEKKSIIKETVPVLQDKGEIITSHFYKRMFKQHPELKICLIKRTNKGSSINCTCTKCFSCGS